MSNVNADVYPQDSALEVAPGIVMYYSSYSSPDATGVPVICLPGYWRNSKDFDALAAHLSTSRRVITPDLRGRGRTSRSENVEDYAFERLIEDVLLLMRTENIESAVFCGTALGAQLGLTLAATRPEIVRGLILNDTGVEPGKASVTKQMAAFAVADAYEFNEIVDRTRAQYEAQFPLFGDNEWRRMALRAYRKLENGKWTRDFDLLTNEILARIKVEHPNWWPEYNAAHGVPVAIIRGENSAYLPEEVAQRMVAEHPRATLYTIAGSGHAPTLWEPESLAAIDDFLALADAG